MIRQYRRQYAAFSLMAARIDYQLVGMNGLRHSCQELRLRYVARALMSWK